MTLSPSAVWEHLLRGGSKLRLSAEALSSDGRYRFHVKDFRQYPDGTLAGYDTTMIRSNSDITSSRVEAMLFSPASGVASWNIHAYFYGSGRGLPGPVYKKAGEYPLSEDRQTDRDAFLQGKYYRDLGDVWSVAGRAKLSFSHLEYTDFPENLPRPGITTGTIRRTCRSQRWQGSVARLKSTSLRTANMITLILT